MPNNTRLLSVALIVFGLAFCLIYPLSIVWPSGWAWHEGAPASNDYFMMIVGVYATLGVFMILASRDPAANRSLIWFVVWSSVVHALVMAAGSDAQSRDGRAFDGRRAGAAAGRGRPWRADDEPLGRGAPGNRRLIRYG